MADTAATPSCERALADLGAHDAPLDRPTTDLIEDVEALHARLTPELEPPSEA